MVVRPCLAAWRAWARVGWVRCMHGASTCTVAAPNMAWRPCIIAWQPCMQRAAVGGYQSHALQHPALRLAACLPVGPAWLYPTHCWNSMESIWSLLFSGRFCTNRILLGGAAVCAAAGAAAPGANACRSDTRARR